MRQLPIFPYRHQYSIFGASELNFCVRYEYRWILTAIITAMVYIVSLNTGISILFSVESLLHRKYITFISPCQLIFLYSALAKSSFRQGSISILPSISFLRDQALDLLVSVSSIHYCTYTSDLSTSSSSRGLTILWYGISYLEVSFTLRCFQRLSAPHFATLLCRWHDNRCTIGAFIPVLSY